VKPKPLTIIFVLLLVTLTVFFGGSPAPLAAASSTEWRTVTTFTGRGSKTTALFFISTSEWRITWEYATSTPAYASFSWAVYRRNETAVSVQRGTETGASKSGVESVAVGNDDFYLKIEAENVDGWSITVEQPASPEAPPSFEWETVTVFTGQGDQTTDVFTVTTDPWRINWEYVTSEPSFATFSFVIYSEGETALYVDSLTEMGASRHDSEYVYSGAGAFYITIVASNVENWSLTVQDGQVSTIPRHNVFTQVIEPTADTYVDNQSPWKNNGDSDELRIWNGYVKHFSFLQFDLQAIPSFVEILSADLVLRVREDTVDRPDPTVVGVYQYPNNSWTEEDLTWDTVNWVEVNQTAIDTVDIDVNQLQWQVWFSWQVTRDVIAARDGVLTLVVASDNMAESVFFYSRETVLTPRLEVTYVKAESSVTCALTQSTITYGSLVNVVGQLTSNLDGTGLLGRILYLENSVNGVDWRTMALVTTEMNGVFTYRWAPSVGHYTVRAVWDGDAVYQGARSAAVALAVESADKASSAITCALSEATITLGGEITVAGAISPPVPGANVTLIYNKPDGASIQRTVVTGADGAYSDAYVPDGTGRWSVTTSWAGDTSYQGASSPSQAFEVKITSFCFIASATYGSMLSPEVQFLRGFRDQQVMATFAGAQFMSVFNHVYYSFSPSVASVIADHALLRSLMKGVLYPLMSILQGTSKVYAIIGFSPELAVVVSGVWVSALIGGVYVAPLLILASRLKRVREQIQKAMQPFAGLVAGSLIMIGAAELASSATMMMYATGMLVVATAGLSALYASTRVLER